MNSWFKHKPLESQKAQNPLSYKFFLQNNIKHL